ncbi:MAG: late competence development ComFB family protein [Firmicutes bacterium]|nr:late competence development ComFB family protein [Bacillota bacterium]
MNLLSRTQSEIPVPHTANSGDERALEKNPLRQSQPIIASSRDDRTLAELINKALLESLQDEVAPGQSLPEAAAGDENSLPQDEAAEAIAAALSQEAEQTDGGLKPEDLPASQPVPLFGDNDDDLAIINVMQILVDENVDRFLQLSGACCCRRCRCDAMAIALNNLIPKYVVTNQSDAAPRISVYEGKVSASITAQLVKACEIVKKNPRH